MNLFQRQDFAKKTNSVIWNTVIGGIGATTSTASLLATKLGIPVGNILNFTVVGVDVYCRITASYEIVGSAFYNDVNITFYNDIDGLVSSLSASSFAGVTKLLYLEFINCLSMSNADNCFSNSSIIGLFLPNCTIMTTSTTSNSMMSASYFEFLYIPKVTTLGSTSANNQVTAGIRKYCKIYANNVLSTNNSGSPDGDLQIVITNYSAVVYYQTNTTKPSAINDLSILNVYDDSVELNWTAPSSSNPISFYKIYANELLVNVVYGTTDVAYNIVSGKTYNFKVTSVDNKGNESLMSNVVSTTVNGSAITFPSVGLANFYKMDDSSTIIVDSKNGNNLTPTSLSFSQSGKINTSIASTISASNAVVSSGVTSINGNFSINIWCYRTGAGVGGTNCNIVEYGGYGAGGFGIWDNGSGILSFRINNDYDNYIVSDIVLQTNVWEMITVVYDGTNIIFYRNGIKRGFKPYTTNPTTSSRIAMFNRGGQTFIGRLDEAGIWNEALSFKEILGLWNKGNGLTY